MAFWAFLKEADPYRALCAAVQKLKALRHAVNQKNDNVTHSAQIRPLNKQMQKCNKKKTK